MNIQGGGGDRAHEATTMLVREAFRAAGDPTKYPEQLREGLRPWQPCKLYFAGAGIGAAADAAGAGGGGAGGRGAGACTSLASTRRALRPAARAHVCGDRHRRAQQSQVPGHRRRAAAAGIAAVAAAAGRRPGGGRGGPGGRRAPARRPRRLAVHARRHDDPRRDGEGRRRRSSTASTSRSPGLARYAGANPPAALTSGARGDRRRRRSRAKQAFDAGNDAGTAAPIEAGLDGAARAPRRARRRWDSATTARYEIDFRLKTKEQDYEDAVLAAHGLSFNAIANDGLVIARTAGAACRSSAVNRGATDVTVSSVAIAGFDGAARVHAGDDREGRRVLVRVGRRPCRRTRSSTEPYFTDTYWKNPSGPARNDVRSERAVRRAVRADAVPRDVSRQGGQRRRDAATCRSSTATSKDLYFGDKRMELNVVPAFSVQRDAGAGDRARAPSGAPAPSRSTREIFVSVTNGTKGAAQATVALEVPAGWKVTPASAPIDVREGGRSRSPRASS